MANHSERPSYIFRAASEFAPDAEVMEKKDVERYVHWLNEEHKADIEELNEEHGQEMEAQALRLVGNKNKEIRHHKYNRCLLRSVIAEMNATHFKDLFYGAGSEALAYEYNNQITIHYKWQKRWLALAEKFKEAK